MGKILKTLKGNKGFSLVELMIVVAIIGILAALAVPKFGAFQAKARQSEAKSNLSQIYTLQMSYYADNDVYAAFNNVSGPSNCTAGNVIGFVPSPCNKLRYVYSSTNDFLATATGNMKKIYPGCNSNTNDVWTIDQNKFLNQNNDGIKSCS